MTPGYLLSDPTRREWDVFQKTRPDAIVPIWLRGNTLDLQGVGQYVEFQNQIRRLAERVAAVVNKAPSTMP
jgi:hypothetical protein